MSLEEMGKYKIYAATQPIIIIYHMYISFVLGNMLQKPQESIGEILVDRTSGGKI